VRILLRIHRRTTHDGDSIGMLLVDRQAPEAQRDGEFHRVAGLPLAVERGPLARLVLRGLSLPVDLDVHALRPARHAELQRESRWPIHCQLESAGIGFRVLCRLVNLDDSRRTLPFDL